MRQRDRGSSSDPDSYGLLFEPSGEGEDTVEDSFFDDDEPATSHRPAPDRPTRSQRKAREKSRSQRRILALGAVLVVVILGLATWLVVLPIYHYFSPQDYSGSGSGSVRITVQANDGATDIADTLKSAGVVASVQAFTDAADSNSKSRSIQPGTYVLHKHMSGSDALTLLLNPSSRQNDDVVVTEGATTLDIAKRLSAKPCSADVSKSAVCGPGFSAAAVQKALKDVAALGVPTDFTVNGKTPSSVEGFLYPATYFFPENSQPDAALNQMIAQFADQVRSTDFTSRAKANGLTPYQQLVAASIAQSEAKYPEDMKKVVRVILNRIASGTPLQSDATSAYGAKLQGLDLSKVIYSQLNSPYNSYTHSGLPPTPISNPGADALSAAAHPDAGNWKYFVTMDSAGHLFFTNSETAFLKAAQTCQKNNWGCG